MSASPLGRWSVWTTVQRAAAQPRGRYTLESMQPPAKVFRIR